MATVEAKEQRCAVCDEPIRPGQSVVGTVDRMIHLECWIARKDGADGEVRRSSPERR